MKKAISLILLSTLFLSSCATVFGGRITECQRHKPKEVNKKRKIRPTAFVFDILIGYGIGLAIDFANGAIYKPCEIKENAEVTLPANSISINATKDELYNRAKKWTAHSFKSSNDVIKLDDKENGKIIIKGSVYYDAPAFKPGTLYSGYYNFEFTFDCKNGKYRYNFSDAYFQPNNQKAWDENFSKNRTWKIIERAQIEKVKDLAKDFENKMTVQYQSSDW